MSTIRDLFHTIGNKHNKITVSAGVLRESLKQKPLTNLSPEELKERSDKLINSLDEMEKTALKADEVLKELRRAVYGLLNPDDSISNKD